MSSHFVEAPESVTFNGRITAWLRPDVTYRLEQYARDRVYQLFDEKYGRLPTVEEAEAAVEMSSLQHEPDWNEHVSLLTPPNGTIALMAVDDKYSLDDDTEAALHQLRKFWREHPSSSHGITRAAQQAHKVAMRQFLATLTTPTLAVLEMLTFLHWENNSYAM